MFNLIKKDLISLFRTRSEAIELLILPILIISILGFALGGIMIGDFSINQFDVGVVNNQNVEEDLVRLEEDLLAEDIPEEIVDELVENAEEIDSATMLIELLESEDFEDQMNVVEFANSEEADTALDEDNISGYVVIPEDFSYSVWRSIYFDEESNPVFEVKSHGKEVISSTIFESIVNSFVDQYNFEASISMATDGQAEYTDDNREYGEVVQLSVEEPVSSFQYYTIGMGVMYTLSVASILSLRAFSEKEEHVLGRVMLSGTKPLTYLMSKFFSGTLISILQLLLLFVATTFIFGVFEGRNMDFWLNMLYITGIYSIFIGSLTSVLVSITLYANDPSTAGFFGGTVAVLGFLGGSMMPLDQFSQTLQAIGNWLPNGAALTSYLQVFQGFTIQEFWPLILRIVVMSAVCILVAVILFPKRRLD